MTSTDPDPKAVHQQFIDALNDRDFEAVRNVLADDVVFHEQGGTVRGVEAVIEGSQVWLEGVPDLEITIKNQWSGQDLHAFRQTLTGTHKGPLIGIEPTGQRFEVDELGIGHQKDGVIVEGWSQADLLGLFDQLGVIESPLGAAGQESDR